MRLETAHNVADLRRSAKRILPAVVFDYVDGAADDETTMRRNETSFDDIVFRPRMGMKVPTPELSTTVLGTRLSIPVMLAPCGLIRIMHPDAGPGAARAAAGRGTVSVLSTVAGSTLEEVAPQAPGAVWFQLYAAKGRPDAEVLLERATAAGIEVLVVTIDTPALGNRERDIRHGVAPPLRIDARNVIHLGPQVLLRPAWAWRMSRDGIRMVRLSRSAGEGAGSAEAGVAGQGFSMLNMAASPFSWDDIAWLREQWKGRLVVKGILSGHDARTAVDHGADGVIVSNHGGRQLDGAPATIRVLPEVVDAVGDGAEVLLDGGIRRGSHVVKALALGARAVLVGRPYLWSLATGGQRGVEHLLDLFAHEMTRTMLLLGCSSVADLGPDWVDQA